MTDIKENLIAVVCVVASVAIILWLWFELVDFLDYRYVQQCKDEVAVGVIKHECRHFWDQCGMYYGDCESGAKYEWEWIDGDHWIARRVP